MARMSENKKTVILVDLDGCLAFYDGEFHGPECIGEPIPAMMRRVKLWIQQGKEVRIFTARAADEENIKPIEQWLRDNGIPGLEITNVKKHDVALILDDRARQVVCNKGIIVQGK